MTRCISICYPKTRIHYPAFSCDHWLDAQSLSVKPLPTTYHRLNCTAPKGLPGTCIAGEPGSHRLGLGAGKQAPHQPQKQKGLSAPEATSTNAHPPHPGQGQDHNATCTRTKISPVGAPGGHAGQRTTAQRDEHTSYTATGTETDQQPPTHRTTHPRQSVGKRTDQAAAQLPAAADDRNDSTTTQPDTERTDRRTTNAPAKTKPAPAHQEETAATEGTIISPPKRTNKYETNNIIVAQHETFVNEKVAQYATLTGKI